MTIDRGLRMQGAALAAEEIENLVLRLYEIEAIKFGQFTLKSGLSSPVYIDLRVIVSFPDVLSKVSQLLWQKVEHLDFDVMCGVPYTALPIATCMSLQNNKTMLMRRKEVKTYGTKKCIEGVFNSGQNCLIVEDLVTSGASVMETVEPLKAVNLEVTDVVVLIDREQGGPERLSSQNLRLHAGFTLSAILNILVLHKIITSQMQNIVKDFIAKNQTFTHQLTRLPAPHSRKFTFEERSNLAKNVMGQELFKLMVRKQTNLAVAVDVGDVEEMLALADLDRKFADIGNTVVSQYRNGIYKIAEWSHITNAHLVSGPSIIDGIKSVGKPLGRGLLLLAEMSSKGSLATGEYTEAVAKLGEENQDFVMGYISVNPSKWRTVCSPGLIHMTPGVQLSQGGDSLGQQYNTPENVIINNGSDIIIVGRGIIKASDPKAAALNYQRAGWRSYLQSLMPEKP